MAIVFPPAPAAGEKFIASNGITYTWNSTVSAWTTTGISGSGGSGGGTVTGVTASAPLASSGGNAPNISATLTDAATAAAGTSASVLMTPQFAVPKDASGMTGAAILPNGTDLQRAAIATPVAGMQRFNTDSGLGEIYTGATGGWKGIQFVPKANPAPPDLNFTGVTTLGGYYVCNNLTINAATLTPSEMGTVIYCQGDVTISASTFNYSGAGPIGGSGTNQNTSFISSTPGSGIGAGSGSNANPSMSYLVSIVGGGGSSGSKGSSTGSNNTSNGGAAGGYILIQALGSISITGTTVNCSGQNGNNSANSRGGGGGGGSGGCISLKAFGNISLDATTTLNVKGGNGGPANNGGITSPCGGGGGGGGGWVILDSQSVLTNSATMQLTGGAVGANAGGAAPFNGGFGGAGGAFGGAGGDGSINANPTAGGTGKLVFLAP
jgi:hypothetical protein